MPGFSRPWGSSSWKKTRSVRRSLEIVGARLRTLPGTDSPGKAENCAVQAWPFSTSADAATSGTSAATMAVLSVGLASNSGSIPA